MAFFEVSVLLVLALYYAACVQDKPENQQKLVPADSGQRGEEFKINETDPLLIM